MIATLAADNWVLFVLRGIFALLFGTLAFLAPGATLAALVLVFAFYAIVDGVLAVAVGLGAPAGPRWLLVVGGIASVAIGIYTGFNPSITTTALVLLVGAFVLVRGIVDVAAAFTLHSVIQEGWRLALSGIVSIAFGAYLLVAPSAGALALVYVIGFYALFAGVMYVSLGIRVRNLAQSVQEAVKATSSSPSGQVTRAAQTTQTTSA